jgi:hypothetical protein
MIIFKDSISFPMGNCPRGQYIFKDSPKENGPTSSRHSRSVEEQGFLGSDISFEDVLFKVAPVFKLLNN